MWALHPLSNRKIVAGCEKIGGKAEFFRIILWRWDGANRSVKDLAAQTDPFAAVAQDYPGARILEVDGILWLVMTLP